MAQKEFAQIYPEPGWVEHDPMEIWASQMSVVTEAVSRIGASADDIAALGITNQRETTVVWDRRTGRPIYNAIVWQCRRTADYINRLKCDGMEDYVRKTTGLVPDAYFRHQSWRGFLIMWKVREKMRRPGIFCSELWTHGLSGILQRARCM